MARTLQERVWLGDFGKEYTNRNMLNPEELDWVTINDYGISRTELNKEFLDGIKPNKILEVGCNAGNQLLLLQRMGYNNLHGIEVQDYAVELAKKRTSGINILKGSAFDIPYEDGFFDMVFTSGVLIHVSPQDINNALDEIYRCTSKYIWGMEFYSDNGYEHVKYRGNKDLLWKTDFSKLFLERFHDLKLIKKKKIPYKHDKNIDMMYLLEKQSTSSQ